MTTKNLTILTISLGFLLLGTNVCATLVKTKDMNPGIAENERRKHPGRVYMRYLGTGGWLMRYRGYTMLMAPFYTNNGYGELCLSETLGCLFPLDLFSIKSDRKRIRERLADTPEILATRAVLAGHGHYDHLLDLPVILRYILKKRPKSDTRPITVYGSRTSILTLRAAICTQRSGGKSAGYPLVCPAKIIFRKLNGVKTLVTCYKNEKNPKSCAPAGKWIPLGPDRQVRFMAIRSEHAPHIPPGIYALPKGARLKQIPDDLSGMRDWKEGRTFAFLLDFLTAPSPKKKATEGRRPGKDQKIFFRVHYQDAASSYSLGVPPQNITETRKTDLAVICAPQYNLVKNYPLPLLLRDLKPGFVMLGHWEDFFTPVSWERLEHRAAPFLNPVHLRNTLRRGFRKANMSVEVWVPRPGAAFIFPPAEKANVTLEVRGFSH